MADYNQSHKEEYISHIYRNWRILEGNLVLLKPTCRAFVLRLFVANISTGASFGEDVAYRHTHAVIYCVIDRMGIGDQHFTRRADLYTQVLGDVYNCRILLVHTGTPDQL